MVDQLQKFMKEALTSYSDGNLDLAEENFKKILSLDQENYQSIYNLGIISFNRKKYTQAEEYLLKAFELNKNEKYLISLVELFIITKDYDNAAKMLETNILLIDKSKKKEFDDKIVKFREFDEIGSILNKISINIEKDNTSFFLTDENLEIELKNRIEKALILYSEDSLVWSIYGQFLLLSEEKKNEKVRDYNEALNAYQRSINIKEDNLPAIINIGILYRRTRQFDKAIDTYNLGKKYFPNEYLIFYNSGILCADNKDFKNAEIDLLKAIELRPNDYAAYTNLGKLYKDTNNLELSEKSYRKMIEIDPKKAQGYRGLGAIMILKGDYNLGYDNLKKSLILDPDNPTAQKNLAICYFRQGKTEEGVKLSKEVAGVLVFNNNNKKGQYKIEK
ncbi:MAG: tetratricopeptide repeat protein [Pseudomonadota bacterium]|nr:tetratricopeptide repeat protein [Pseudomonadota bacterium]